VSAVAAVTLGVAVSTVTRRRPTAKPAASRRAAKPALRKRRSVAARLAHVLGQQSDDVWGLALLVLAGLCGLAIYSSLAGPAGRALNRGTADAVGWSRYLLAPALASVGWALLLESHERSRRRPPRGESEERPARPPSRVALGAAVFVVATAGIADEIGGPAHWHGALAALRPAGGLVGAGMGVPLRAGVGVWGAALVLSALFAASLLILTGTPARDAAHWLYVGAASIARAARSLGRFLGAQIAGAQRRAAAARHPSTAEAGAPPPYDVEADGTGTTGADTSTTNGSELPSADTAGVAKAVPIHLPPPDQPVDPEQLSISLGPAAQPGTWRLPPVALLHRTKAAEIDRKYVESMGHTLEAALAAHGVDTRLVGMTVGPTVTRYELELGAGVKVAKVTNLQRDIAYAMAAADVRILAPIPGRSAIGVEVPNHQRQLVAVGDILASAEAHAATHPLEVALGRDIAGRPVIENLATMPHILIAGATGAGKSSCINSVLTSILVRATPDQVRLILVDPKRVELGQYNGLPHLLTGVVTNPKKAANALAWAVHEMERRYDLLAEVGVRDVTGYNAAFDRGELEGTAGLGEEPRTYDRLPFILVVVDELNDLMMVAARDVEESICRIAQMARAVGIHLVIATQRPSVDVITGVIKANIPSRLAFAVSSLADSRVILDQPGAERLIGKGDMLLLSASSSVSRRIQGAWVTEEEVRKVVAHWRRQSAPRYVEGVEGSEDGPGSPGRTGFGDDDDDDLLDQARELVVRSQLGSTSMLQRKLRVGFARAGRLMDLLEQRGVVGPSEGSKARSVLMTIEELENLQESGA
jgi:S-DNA-T family DNA segregation ATPase FtsK/SpoIIIE